MQEIILNVVCLFISLFALGVAVWAVVRGTLATQGVDALFMLAVCLVVALLFGWMPAQWLRRSRLRDLLKRKKNSAAADDSARRATAGATQPQERET
jgi:hypothetical protein